MPAMLREICERYKIAILADGVPLLQEADIDFHGKLKDALDRIADLFDYSVTMRKSGAVSMMKRFTNPEDRPQLNPAEVRRTASDMLTILPTLPYDLEQPPLWARLIRRELAPRLTPEQIDAMKQGKKIIPTDLPPNLQRTLAEIVLIRAYGDARSMWERIYRQLDRFDYAVLRAEKHGVFTSVSGKSTASYSVIMETRGTGGTVSRLTIGEFERTVKP
jgi:hypothetical protein